jgi:hypothetical protein
MTESEPLLDEVGEARGPQAAAQAALEVEIDGHEGDGAAQAPAAEPQPVDDGDQWREILYTAFRAGFSLCEMRWPAMKTSDAECVTLAAAWTPVLQKHAGASIPIEVVAGLATLAIIAPKALLAHAQTQAQSAAKAAEQEHRDATTAHV